MGDHIAYFHSRKACLKFIDRAYEYLDEKFPGWKRNKYYFANKKNLVFRSKALVKLAFVYCNFLPVKM